PSAGRMPLRSSAAEDVHTDLRTGPVLDFGDFRAPQPGRQDRVRAARNVDTCIGVERVRVAVRIGPQNGPSDRRGTGAGDRSHQRIDGLRIAAYDLIRSSDGGAV